MEDLLRKKNTITALKKKSSEEIMMKCPYLMKWVSFACKASERFYFPTPFQLKNYCTCVEYKKCPFYIRRNNEYLEETCSWNLS